MIKADIKEDSETNMTGFLVGLNRAVRNILLNSTIMLTCHMIIDGGSSTNATNPTMVEKLGLPTTKLLD